MERTTRALAFVAIVLAHIALVALLMTPYRRAVRAAPDESYMVLVSVEPEARARSEPSGPAPLSPVRPETISPPPVDLSSSAITVPPEVSAETPPKPSVDWQAQAQTAAARTAEALEAERRRKGKFAPDPRFARPVPRPEFGWDQSKIHRLEALPEGGTLIHLNDRCVLVLNGGLFPACKLGKIEARGDLFEHMGDASPLDDSLPSGPGD